MGRGSNRRRAAAVALTAGTVALASTIPALAQLLPGPSSQDSTTTTATTEAPSTTTTTEPPFVLFPSTIVPPPDEPTPTTAPSDGDDGSGGAPPTTAPPAPAPGETTPLPAAAPIEEGEGGEDAGAVGRIVPVEAQVFIDSIPRTAALSNDALVQGVALVEAAGVSHEDAARAVYGRFPIQGPAHWSDDWYFPRWTGTTFRYHQGLDMFAAFGTPVAAPVDGIARIGQNALGGLTVQVHEPDGTYWYLAHLSGTAPGLLDGSPVATGQVVGYVGDSGNARGGAPHLHFGVYPQGGPAAPPKPVVDQWVVDGAARVTEILTQLGAAPVAATAPAIAPTAPVTTTPRRAAGADVGAAHVAPSQGELLWASAANPTGGAVQVADAATAVAAQRIDWTRIAAEQRAADLAWDRAVDRARRLLAPLTNPVLRQAVESIRSGNGPR